jgi:hypothetical protein
VLSSTVLPQAQRVQKLYMHAYMVMPLMVARMTRTASLSTSHSSRGLPPHHRQGARCCLPNFGKRYEFYDQSRDSDCFGVGSACAETVHACLR